MATHKSGGGQWGISWAEVAATVELYEEQYSCRLEHQVIYTRSFPSARTRQWSVYCRAISGRDGAYRVEGYAACMVGSRRGAASFPGAFIRSLIDACEDLARRRVDKRHDRDNPVPGRD